MKTVFTSFKLGKCGTNDYFKAIYEINDVYREILTIREANKVFNDPVCYMMMFKTKDLFNKA